MRWVLRVLGAMAIAALWACTSEAPQIQRAANTPGLAKDAAVLKGRPATPAAKATPSPTPSIKATTATAATAKTTATAIQVKPTTTPAAVKVTPAATPIETPVARITPMPPKEETKATTPSAAATPAAKATPAAPGNPVVVLKTNLGIIEVELDPAHAPITVQNFLYYVQSHHYDGTIFHRVMSTFMIQGGGFTPGLKEKGAGAPAIKNESGNGLSNMRGAIAMARTQALDSATCQFYINVVNNPGLDQGRYCVFGKVVSGMDVVDKIRAVKTHSTKAASGIPLDNVPVETVLIESAAVK